MDQSFYSLKFNFNHFSDLKQASKPEFLKRAKKVHRKFSKLMVSLSKLYFPEIGLKAGETSEEVLGQFKRIYSVELVNQSHSVLKGIQEKTLLSKEEKKARARGSQREPCLVMFTPTDLTQAGLLIGHLQRGVFTGHNSVIMVWQDDDRPFGDYNVSIGSCKPGKIKRFPKNFGFSNSFGKLLLSTPQTWETKSKDILRWLSKTNREGFGSESWISGFIGHRLDYLFTIPNSPSEEPTVVLDSVDLCWGGRDLNSFTLKQAYSDTMTMVGFSLSPTSFEMVLFRSVEMSRFACPPKLVKSMKRVWVSHRPFKMDKKEVSELDGLVSTDSESGALQLNRNEINKVVDYS